MSRWSPKPAPGEPDGLILFDGVCGFCSLWIRFVLRHDQGGVFRFLPVQSEPGRALAARFGIDPQAPETTALVWRGRMLFKSDAALAVLGTFPATAPLALLRGLPRWLRDPAYDLVARNRYAVFGRSETCMIPSPKDRERFLG